MIWYFEIQLQNGVIIANGTIGDAGWDSLQTELYEYFHVWTGWIEDWAGHYIISIMVIPMEWTHLAQEGG